MRIVSLLPAATRIVEHLGMTSRLVGVSHQCFGQTRLPVVTRSRIRTDLSAAETDAQVRDFLRRGEPLFDLDERLLLELRPDVILSQALCNICALDGGRIQRVLARLDERTSLVEHSPTTLDGVIAGIERIAQAIGASIRGKQAVRIMRRELFSVCQWSAFQRDRPSVVFLEWMNPMFCCGHWIPELIELAGGEELIGRRGGRSATIMPTDLRAADPDILLLICCGWPADRTQAELASIHERSWWRSLKAVRSGRVYLMDAESSFTMPGFNLIDDCRRLAAVIHQPSHTLCT